MFCRPRRNTWPRGKGVCCSGRAMKPSMFEAFLRDAEDDAVKAQGAGPSSSQEGPVSGVRRIEKRFLIKRTASRRTCLRVEWRSSMRLSKDRLKVSSQPGALLVWVRNPERPCAPGLAGDGVAAAARSNRTGRTLGVGRRPLTAPGSADEKRLLKNYRGIVAATRRTTCSVFAAALSHANFSTPSKNARVAPLDGPAVPTIGFAGKPGRRHREVSGTRKAVKQSESLFVLTPEATGTFPAVSESAGPPALPILRRR